jgi:outer membrane protein insertion porin family
MLSFSAAGQDDGSSSRLSNVRRQVVKRVELQGVRSFPPSEIEGLLFTKPNRWYNFLKKRRLSRSNVKYDERTIERFYKRRGFLFASAGHSVMIDEGGKAIVTFEVEEGRRTYLSDVGIEGGVEKINTRFDKTLWQFKTGEPVNASQVLSGNFILRDIYHDNGYPYAKITSKYNYKDGSTEADIQYVVAESVYAVNGETMIARNGITNRNVILRELAIKVDEEYKREDIIESERRLYSTGLFRYLAIRRYDYTFMMSKGSPARVGFSLDFEERKPFFVNGGIGIGREEDFEMVLRGSVRFGNRNLLGTGRKLYVGFEPRFQILDPQGALPKFGWSDFRKKLSFKPIRTSFELNYIEPWFLSRRIPMSVRLIYEPHTFNPTLEKRYDRAAVELRFTYELDRFTTARLTGATEYVDFRDIPEDQQEVYRAEGDNQIRRKIQIYGERDTRDNLFVPQHGSYSFMGVEYIGSILGGDFGYRKAQFSWSRYQILSGQNIVASRIWVGWVDDLGKDDRSSVEDRFLIGGGTTIRGHAENSLGPVFTEADDPGEKLGRPKGGRYLILGNIEIRRPLFWRFGGTVFIDAGNTYFDLDDITLLSVAFTTGLGVQFFTPIGPIRFDYGVRMKKDLDLGAGNYHLSILYAF